jgi:hypothetical protein
VPPTARRFVENRCAAHLLVGETTFDRRRHLQDQRGSHQVKGLARGGEKTTVTTSVAIAPSSDEQDDRPAAASRPARPAPSPSGSSDESAFGEEETAGATAHPAAVTASGNRTLDVDALEAKAKSAEKALIRALDELADLKALIATYRQ